MINKYIGNLNTFLWIQFHIIVNKALNISKQSAINNEKHINITP